jgi:prolipoprotein diacylglyceryltransferase
LVIEPQHRIVPYNDLATYPPETLFHPTFLYESLWCLLVFVGLALIAEKLKDRLLPGDILLGYLIGYPLGRFFIEYLRPDAWMVGPIAAAQLFAIICVVVGIALMVVNHAVVGKRRPVPAESTGEALAEDSEFQAEAAEAGAEVEVDADTEAEAEVGAAPEAGEQE